MSNRSIGALLGALFLAAFVCYGSGGLLAESVTGGRDLLGSVGDHSLRLTAGAAAMLLNCVVVCAIGVLGHRVLEQRSPLSATAYLLTRTFEATLLAVGAVMLLMIVQVESDGGSADLAGALVAGNELAFQVAMVGLGIGSLPFCWALLQHRLVARPLAVWGIAGYAALAIGATLELFDVPAGVALAIPGGLFEIALGLTLIRRGLPEPVPAPRPQPLQTQPLRKSA